MKVLRSILTLALLVLAAVSITAPAHSDTAVSRRIVLRGTNSPSPEQRRLALVIGNSHYGPPFDLKNPENDARAVGDALRTRGFDVTLVLDVSRDSLRNAINDFGRDVGSGGGNTVALLYYSGHGMEVNGKNYLVPIGFTPPPSVDDLDDYAYPVQRALDKLADARAQVSVVILDACRNNPFSDARAWGGKGLAKIETQGMYIAYATAAGSVASDNSDAANGLYTQELLRNLVVPGLNIHQVFQKTRSGVYEKSGRQQWPYVYDGLLSDDFFFSGKPVEQIDTFAHLRLSGTDADSIIAVDGAPQSKPTIDLDLGPQTTKSVKVTVTKPGFRAYTATVQLNRGVQTDLVVALDPLPIAPPAPQIDTIAHLRLNGVAQNAAISVDGSPQSNSAIDLDLKENRTRSVKLEVRQAGYKNYSATVLLKRGVETDIDIAMDPLPPPPAPVDTNAHLRIKGFPDGATVLVDGVPQSSGLVDVDLGDKKNRSITVSVTAVGYKPFSKSVKVSRGDKTDVEVRMDALPPPPAPVAPVQPPAPDPIIDTKAHLKITGLPPGAVLVVDGKQQSSGNVDVEMGDKKNRTVNLTVNVPGYKPYEATVKLVRGAEAALNFSMDPLPTPPAVQPAPVAPPTVAPVAPSPGAPAVNDPRVGTIKKNRMDGAEMVFVPAGPFTMGTDSGGAFKNADPMHKVNLDGYWIYRYPVTNEQYTKFCRATNRIVADIKMGSSSPNAPAIMVTWDDANAYAIWASALLPTEAQWEKAARGTDGRTYPWGNDWDTNKCVNGNKATHAMPVGSCRSGDSPYGVSDMAGNVWQWCNDYYDADYYSKSPADNPQGPESGTEHVIRGGSFTNNYSKWFTTFGRSSDIDGSSTKDRGFRCVVPAF